MKLINAKPSPFGRKVAIALIEKNIPYETVWDQPWGDETIVRSLNPMEQLPILITDDGTTVYESDFILEWLEFHYPDPPLYPSGAGRLEVRRLQMLAAGLIDAFGRALFEAKRTDRSAAWMDRQTRKLPRVLDEIGKSVAGRPYAYGDRLTAADLSIGCVINLIEFISGEFAVSVPEFDWRANHPVLIAYIDGLEARPSFVATRPQPFAEAMPFEQIHA